MKTIFLFIVAGVLAVATCGCSDGGQTGDSNSTQNYTPDAGTETDTEPWAYIDNYATCVPVQGFVIAQQRNR